MCNVKYLLRIDDNENIPEAIIVDSSEEKSDKVEFGKEQK